MGLETGATDARSIKLSRYVLLARLGSGGAGVVYSAYDPELDRRVAIKLLLPAESHQNADDTDVAVRLMREAQATARLSHPNVIAIHDVGTYDLDDAELAALISDLERDGEHTRRSPTRRGVFVVMELVVGPTLREWLAAAPHTWAEILPPFVQAGEGLAAAHEGGLIHRDFKPANVLVGADRVRVLDFGLARLVSRTNMLASDEQIPRSSDSHESAESESTVQYPEGVLVPSTMGFTEVKILESRLTRTGAVMGTPPYMPPEQHDALPTDARSDQYAFCVALYEAVYGQRPFKGKTMNDLAAAKRRGPPDPPNDARVPARVRDAILRGLRAAPDDRFPSMRALLDALTHDPSRRLRRIGAAVALGLGVVVLAGGLQLRSARQEDRCRENGGDLVTRWGAAEGPITAAFAAVDRPFADHAWDTIAPRLAEYTGEWSRLRGDACVAAIVRGELAPEPARRRIECLERAENALDELLLVLGEADADVAEHAVEAVDALPELAACTDDEALLSMEVLPVESERDRVREIEAELTRAEMLRSAGRYDRAFSAARAAADASETLSHGPTRARAYLALADAHSSLAEYDPATNAARQAWIAAERAGHQESATEALIRLIALVGYHGAHHEEARHLAAITRARVEHRRVGEQDARLCYQEGLLEYAQAHSEEAAERLEESVRIWSERLGPDHREVARAYNLLGAVLFKAGELDRAREALERALEIQRNLLGPSHPEVAQPLNNLALVQLESGDHQGALARFEETLQIRRAALGERHELVSASLMNIGIAYMAMDEFEKSLDYMARSAEITLGTYGPSHPITADSAANLGRAYDHLGRREEAIAQHERALSIRKAVLEPDHQAIADAHGDLGRARLLAGRYTEAVESLAIAIEMIEARDGPEAPQLATPLTGLGAARSALGRDEDAVPLLERALRLDASEEDSVAKARIRFALARAFRSSDPARARGLALAASPAYMKSKSKLDDPAALAALLDELPKP